MKKDKHHYERIIQDVFFSIISNFILHVRKRIYRLHILIEINNENDFINK